MASKSELDRLSERIKVDIHARPNRLRTWTRRSCAALTLLLGAWVALLSARGARSAYMSEHVSRAHRMFEHDCARCHDRLGPASHPFSSTEWNSSVSNRKCVVCHAGAEHNARQLPAHEDLLCANCHHEHRGERLLADVADSKCLDCHADLKEHLRHARSVPDLAATGGATGGPPELQYAASIRRFDPSDGGSRPESGAHPEFLLHLRLRDPASGREPVERYKADPGLDPLESFEREPRGPADPMPERRLQDRGRIAFNHAAHLKAEWSGGKLEAGLFDEKGTRVDFSKRCDACHQPEADGRAMRPISYQDHCSRCHPLRFDRESPKEVVPHGVSPDTVRGHLLELFIQRKRKADAAANPAPKPAADDRPTFPPALARKGLSDADLLELQGKAAGVVKNLPVPFTLEIEAARAAHGLLGHEARGGCRYCHSVKDREDREISEIVKPEIPRRWLPDSRFDHETHRAFDCNACHRDFSKNPEGTPVSASQSTGDVLIPTIDVCRKCHNDRTRSIWSFHNPTHDGTSTRCVECHSYHRHAGENSHGKLGLDLNPFSERGAAERLKAVP